MQKFIVIAICLFHALTAYNLSSITLFLKADINKTYVCPFEKKNTITLTKADKMIYNEDNSTIGFTLSYSWTNKDGSEIHENLKAIVNYI
jgi:hypothetical protein